MFFAVSPIFGRTSRSALPPIIGSPPRSGRITFIDLPLISGKPDVNMSAKRKLRYGMIGGGQNAFIGAVHRMAANLDGQIELVAGAFSSEAKNSKTTGEQLFLNPRRAYGSYEEM